jgi:nucleoside-diphosphate-sugar epimerase
LDVKNIFAGSHSGRRWDALYVVVILHDELLLCVTGNEQKTAHLWALPGAKERLELVKADLLTAGSYDEAVSGCDGVFHTATAVVLIKSDPQSEMIDPAVFGTLNVLRSCKKSRSVKRVVMTSSSAAVRFNSIFPSAGIGLDETVWSSVPLCTQYKLRIKID